MTDDTYVVLASEESRFQRSELREYPHAYHAVLLRSAVGGGWYVHSIMVISKSHEPDDV